MESPDFLQFTFQDFLKRFEDNIQLPFFFSTEVHHDICKANYPLPLPMVRQFISGNQSLDEFTEITPCFKLKNTRGFHALVYWEARLLEYRYILATYDKHGILIQQLHFAGTHTEDDKVIDTIALLLENDLLYCVEGSFQEGTYDPHQILAGFHTRYQLMPHGSIQQLRHDGSLN